MALPLPDTGLLPLPDTGLLPLSDTGLLQQQTTIYELSVDTGFFLGASNAPICISVSLSVQ
jgi:hypothetical protein